MAPPEHHALITHICKSRDRSTRKRSEEGSEDEEREEDLFGDDDDEEDVDGTGSSRGPSKRGSSGRLKSKEGADSPVNLFDLAMVHRALRMC